MTARQEGADQPHHHVVDPAALALATRTAMIHIRACVVCTLASLAVQRRGIELEALGDIASTPAHNRGRRYAETRLLYCAEGLPLMLRLGDAALGVTVADRT